MNDKFHVIPTAISSSAAGFAVLPVINTIVQIIAGVIAIIAGGITIYKWYKDRKVK